VAVAYFKISQNLLGRTEENHKINHRLADLRIEIRSRAIKSGRMRWAGHVTRVSEMRNAYRNLVGKPEGKRPLGGHRRRCEDNIRKHLRDKGWEGVDRMHLAQVSDQWWALVITVMNIWVP
jgi:hypothetical protein